MVQRLLETVGEQGYLTTDQILEALPEMEDDLEQLEDLLSILQDRGIEVYHTVSDAEEHGAATLGENGKDDKDRGDMLDLSRIPISDTLGLYLREMGHVPLLTHEEEVTLARQMERGREAQLELDRDGHNPQERVGLKQLIDQGAEARQHLIKANTRLVVSVARRYRGLGLSFLDLIQAGNLGLIKAADRFDHRRGYKFGTYATWWIRQGVTRALSQQGRTIRIPVHMTERIRKLIKVAQRMEQRSGRRPTPEEIGGEVGLEPNKVRWMLRVSTHPMSLDKPVGDEEGADEFGSFVEDDDAPSPAQSAEQHLLREDLNKMLIALTPREARILRLRFGLQGDRSHTLEEIGNKIGVTRERVRQIESKALRKLRHPRHRRRLRSYLARRC